MSNSSGLTHQAIAILAYAGMRVGELEQLEWADVLLDRGELGMFHIRRGGSGDAPKDKDERFVPIHPRITPILRALDRTERRVLPELVARRLLSDLKELCHTCVLSRKFKVHSLRHHFASMCANHQVAYKKALAWLGHSSSDILDLYYHLHDAESEAAMQALARDHAWGPQDAPKADDAAEGGSEIADIYALVAELGATGKALTEQDLSRLRQSLLATDKVSA